MLDSDVPLIEVPIRFRDCTVLNKMAALQHVSLNCNDLDLKFSYPEFHAWSIKMAQSSFLGIVECEGDSPPWLTNKHELGHSNSP